jgi:hypothetical protein
MSSAPIKKLPASPGVSSPSVPVADRGGEEVNVGFGDFGAGRGDKLRDLRARRSAGNDRKFCLGNEFHMSPLLYHIKVMFYSREQTKVRLAIWSIKVQSSSS